MKLTSKALAAIILVLIFGGIAASAALGWWQTEGSRVPQRFSTGEHAGEYNPADIRGSYSFQDISEAFAIPVETLARAFALPADLDAGATQVKELETIYADLEPEIGTDSVRWFVSLYTGLPYQPGESVCLLRPGVNILRNQVTLSAEQQVLVEACVLDPPNLEDHTPVTEPGAAGQGQGGEPGPEVPDVHLEENATTVKGKTTFADLLDLGLPQETIEQVIGGEMPNRLTLVRDYCSEQGLAFGEIKAALQAEIDALDQ